MEKVVVKPWKILTWVYNLKSVYHRAFEQFFRDTGFFIFARYFDIFPVFWNGTGNSEIISEIYD